VIEYLFPATQPQGTDTPVLAHPVRFATWLCLCRSL
jgi:hypothetical protein